MLPSKTKTYIFIPIRFQSNKPFENFINIINIPFRLWSKIRGSCHHNNTKMLMYPSKK